MSKGRRSVLLVAMALILGGLAAGNVAKQEQEIRSQLGSYTKVTVANGNIPAGTAIKASQLAVKSVPKRFAPVDGEPVPERFLGVQLAVDLPQGSYLTQSMLASNGDEEDNTLNVKPGERAVDLIAVGSIDTIQPGTRVDVLITRGADESGKTVIALENIAVLAASDASGSDTSATDGGMAKVAVTLKVKLKQAIYLAAAQNFAREIRLLPRAQGDRSRGKTGLGISSEAL